MKIKTFIDNISRITKLKLLEYLKTDNETINSIKKMKLKNNSLSRVVETKKIQIDNFNS